MRRSDIEKAVGIVLGTVLVTGLFLFQTRRMSPGHRLMAAVVCLALVLLVLREQKHPGRYASLPKGMDMPSIFGQAWGRRRRGASNPRRINSEDASPIVPKPMQAREEVCPTCQARLPTVVLICPRAAPWSIRHGS